MYRYFYSVYEYHRDDEYREIFSDELYNFSSNVDMKDLGNECAKHFWKNHGQNINEWAYGNMPLTFAVWSPSNNTVFVEVRVKLEPTFSVSIFRKG
jgi:hypothetical protein